MARPHKVLSPIAPSLLMVVARIACSALPHTEVMTPDYASIQILTTRAEHETAQHHYKRAEQLLEEARTLGERALSTPDYSHALDIIEQLSLTYLALGNMRQVVEGDLAAASSDYARSRSLIGLIGRDEFFWWKPQDIKLQLDGWTAKLHVAQGRLEEAARDLDLFGADQEHELTNPSRTPSVQKEEFGGSGGLFGRKLEEPSQCNIATTLALAIGSGYPPATRIGFECVLRNKGREADVVGHDTAMLRRAAPIEFAKYSSYLGSASRTELDGWLSDRGWGHTLSLDEKLANERETASLRDSAAALTLAVLRSPSVERPVPVEISAAAVRRTLPQDTVLVEFQAFRPFDGTANLANKRNMWLRPHYVAYILGRTGDPEVVDLGPTEQIDHLVRRFRFQLNPVVSSREISSVATVITSLVIDPIRRHSPGAKIYLVSPDGALDLLPFGALQDPDGQYLVESLSFSYLTSGRDLLTENDAISPRSPPLFVGFPCFDDDGTSPPTPRATCRTTHNAPVRDQSYSGDGRRQWSLESNRFESNDINSTLDEVTEIARHFREPSLLIGDSATEQAVKQVKGPSILHIATHAFFVRDPANSPEARILDDETVTNFDVGVAGRPTATQIESLKELTPLVRSGLALSGANILHSGANDDGILTALEVSVLDLTGTQLVTLSACQTGLADVTYGGSVTGLRRAFHIAGAASEVVSLWSVNDKSTSDLMIRFYEKLGKGEPIFTALRHAQLALLNGTDPNRRHPYYWAAFLPSGGRAALEPLQFGLRTQN